MALDFLNAKQLAIMTQLHPALKGRMTHVLEVVEGRFVPLAGYRSNEEQAKLYEKGRTVVWGPDWTIVSEVVTAKKSIVTNAPPGKTAHNFSPARGVDCVLNPAVIGADKLSTTTFAGKTYPNLWDTKSPAAVEAWRDFAKAVKDTGLVWGGDWRMRDMPHCELVRFASSEWDLA